MTDTAETDFGDDGETVLACPACDSARVWRRTHADSRWRCSECGETFDSGVERERRIGGGHATRGLARRLEETN
jgi:ribosomal protein L37AE/L43A